MNKPIRTMAVACMVLFLGAAAQRHLRAVLPAPTTSTTATATGGSCDAEFSRKRGAILVAGNPVAESVPSDDQFEYQRHYPAAVQVRPPHRLLLLPLRRHRRGVEPEPDPLRQRPAALRQPGRRHGQQHPARGRHRLAHHRPGGADRGVRRRSGRSAADTQAAVVALEPSTGRILAMVSNPTYDPNLLASHDLDERAGGLRPARSTPRASRCSTGRSRRSIRRGRRSSWSPRPPRSRAATTTPTPWCRAASSSTCPRPTTRCRTAAAATAAASGSR